MKSHTISLRAAVELCRGPDAKLALLSAVAADEFPIALSGEIDSPDSIHADTDFFGGKVLFAEGTVGEYVEDIRAHVRDGYRLEDYYILSASSATEIDSLVRETCCAALDERIDDAERDRDEHGRAEALAFLAGFPVEIIRGYILGKLPLHVALGATDQAFTACSFVQLEACGHCDGSRKCRVCRGRGTMPVMRTNWPRLVALVRGEAGDLTPEARRVGDSAAELARELFDAADEAETVQEEIGGPYRGDGYYGSRVADHLLATADVEGMRNTASGILDWTRTP